MEQSCREKHPAWVSRPEGTVYGIVLTHDLDSLLATAAYKKMYPNDPIIGFYDFKEEFRLCGDHSIEDIVYIDANMTRNKCWGNHPMLLQDDKGVPVVNRQSVNLNNWFGNPTSRYDDKVHFSTTLHLLSYYGFDLKQLTDPDALGVLMMIDGVYNTFLGNNQKWIDKDTHYLENVLEYPELVYFMDTHSSYSYFQKLDQRIGVFRDVQHDPVSNKVCTHINTTELTKMFEPWGLDFSLPKGDWKRIATYNYDAQNFHKRHIPSQDNVHSCSWNSTKKMYVSTLKTLHV